MKKKHQHNLDYYAYCSGLRGWNSIFKVVFSLFALFLVIGADSLWISIYTIVFMAVLLIAKGKVHLGDYLNLLKIPIIFILMSGVAIAVQFGENSAGEIWKVHGGAMRITCFGTAIFLSKTGIMTACNVALKALGAVSAMYMLTLSTPVGNILAVFQKFHVPAVIVELMHLIYRYIFLLSDIHHEQRDAATSRMGYHSYRSSLRSFSFELSNLLVIALKRANACYDAMEARGYDGKLCMLEEEHTLTAGQIVIWIGYVVGIGVLVGINRFLG